MVTGHYEQKQLLSRSRIVAWSHSTRFRMARRLVEPYAGKMLLDYGCGDATFLKQIQDLFPHATGADVSQFQLEDCRARFPSLSFTHTNELKDKFDVITCMEVLEHCVPDIRGQVISHLASLIEQDGTIIISVPVEIGLTLVGKQIVRRIAGWRGIGDYKWTESYSIAEMLRMVFATADTAISRPVYDNTHTHKGFNWRALEKQIKESLTIKCRLFTPLNGLGGIVSSQAWFICERKHA